MHVRTYLPSSSVFISCTNSSGQKQSVRIIFIVMSLVSLRGYMHAEHLIKKCRSKYCTKSLNLQDTTLATKQASSWSAPLIGQGLTRRWDCYLMQKKCSLIAGLAGKESTLNHIPPSLILTVTPLGPFSSPKLTTCETKQTQICDPHCEIISLVTMHAKWSIIAERAT